MAKTQAQAIEQVRNLLELGEKTDNENESASAIARAQAIMERYKIEAATLEVDAEAKPDEEIGKWDDSLAETRQNWQRSLAVVLAKANGVGIYLHGPQIKMVGRASSVTTVRYLFRYCRNEVQRLAARQSGNGATWLNNYRHGCVDAIRAAIALESKATRDTMRAEAQSAGGSALVKLETAVARVDTEGRDVERWMSKNMRLGRGSSSSHRGNAGARAQGRSDGAGIYPGGSGSKIGAGQRRIGG